MSHSWRFAAALAALVLVSGAAVAAATGAFQQNHSHSTPAHRSATASVGPGPATTLLRARGYRLELRLRPNRATVARSVSLTLSRGGKPVSGARVRLTFTMLDMDMGGLTGLLPQTAPGRHAHAGPFLGMSGRWGLRLDIAPPHAASFRLKVLDRVGA